MHVDAASEIGLSAAEAELRLKRFGPNELPNPERRSLLRIAAGTLRQPMFALLLAGSLPGARRVTHVCRECGEHAIVEPPRPWPRSRRWRSTGSTPVAELRSGRR